MNKFFRYFHFNTVERQGFIALTVLVLLINGVLFIYKYFAPIPSISHKLYALEPTDRFSIINEVRDESAYKSSTTKKSQKPISYFHFDPNTITNEDWTRLGLSSKQSKVILNYTAKGGRFYKKEDLKKIYSITERDYNRLEPYIRLETRKSSPQFISSEKTNTIKSEHSKKKLKVFINSADTAELKRLKGIGSVLAARIVKFRDALGGFHSVEQLREVYGISQEAYDSFKDNIIIKLDDLKKLDVNTLNEYELSKHPYINKKQAKLIVNHRKENGLYMEFNNLFQNKALDTDFLRKIEPYLEFK